MSKSKAEMPVYLLLIFLLVVPLVCAIGLASVGYPNPIIYIPLAFLGAFIGAMAGIFILAGIRPRRVEEAVNEDEDSEN